MRTKGILLLLGLLAAGGAAGVYLYRSAPTPPDAPPRRPLAYQPRQPIDTGGFILAGLGLRPWDDPTSLEDIRTAFDRLGYRNVAQIDRGLAHGLDPEQDVKLRLAKASLLLYEGEPEKAYQVLQEARNRVPVLDRLCERWLYTIIFFQGVAALRRGETENCIACRGEGACIFPLRPSAVHTNPAGSRLAVGHFTEYLDQFPDDLGVRWLLNLACMTLGEYPSRVPPAHLLTFDGFGAEADIGRFRDVAHLVGLGRLNMAGGAIMDDFDNDGLLDVLVSTWDAGESLTFYRNKGDGTFEDRTKAAGLARQYAGFNLVQTDYNNDGRLDVFVSRGGWFSYPMRPTLLRNNGGTFTDVTKEAGLIAPANSLSGAWADFDNDGFLDLFVCCEKGPNRLYRNKGDGTFEDVAARAGVLGKEKECKGAAWLDFDNDGWPDLFVTYLQSTPLLFHNNHDGTFTDVTAALGIDGPKSGFSCWAFDYDNDGWPDIFATCYDRSLADLVRGMQGGQPISKDLDVTRLWRNLGGKGFRDVSKETGIDKVFATMGCNFADFDNDGYLDFYLGTGDPFLETLVPNRMFQNVGGRRFADVTATSGTGQLQKGHGVACGDWDRDGNVDLFVELGGATPGDRYHNALFQNPGRGNNWLTLKLIGRKTNRAAIGARIKVVTACEKPLTIYRHVTSGSSFGANPLQQTVGLGRAASVATLEIWWPTSRTTQVFHDVAVNQAIEVTEFAPDYRKLNWTPLPSPLRSP
jgi:hypothetical protein